jgi:hypothetical protein
VHPTVISTGGAQTFGQSHCCPLSGEGEVREEREEEREEREEVRGEEREEVESAAPVLDEGTPPGWSRVSFRPRMAAMVLFMSMSGWEQAAYRGLRLLG